MTDLDTLQGRLDDWGVRHFRARELARLSQRGTVEVPDEGLVDNIAPTARLADTIRHALGSPVRVVSGYRPPEYNDLVNGSPTSEHMRFRALDLQPVRSERMAEFRKIAIASVLAGRQGDVDARILHYDTFVHVDVGADEDKPRGEIDMRGRA